MSKSMLINVIQEEESRVAIVDGGVLDFFEIETLTKETLKGNIYKGVVENVNAALEAAFVDCGWERPGFLPLDEVNFRVLPKIKTRKSGARIQEHIAPGMEILVQVIRDSFNSKPPSLTTYYSLPGRYLVLTPFSDGSGISRRIEDEEQRSKLRQMVEALNPPEGFGVIVRTAGLDQESGELVRDMGYLLRLWETVDRAASIARAPSLIYRERDLALRTIRDMLTDDIEEVFVDDPEVHESAIRFIRAVAPHQEPLIKLYSGDKPLFSRFNLEDQIETIYKRRVPLKSGGEIVIEETEAMTAIDVNSSRSREASVEEMALRTNLEAAAEIARQLRLRDLGGLIVIDFIDMEAAKHARAVEKALRDGMRRDKAKYDATKISKLGILEISRQRLKAAKATATYVTCPECEGAGTVRTTEAAALAALRRIQTRVARGDVASLKATLPTEVALYLLNQKRVDLLELEKRHWARIALHPRPDYAKERCEIETVAREGAMPGVVTPPARPARIESRGLRGREAAQASRARSETSPPATSPSVSRSSRRGPLPASERLEEPIPDVASRVDEVSELGEPAAATERVLAAGPPEGSERELPTPEVGFDEARPVSEAETGAAGEGSPGAETEGFDAGEDSGSAGIPGETAAGVTLPPGTDSGTAPATDTADAGGRKRRRRRGGRGRRRKGGAQAGGELVAPVATESAEEAPTERLVWEDAEEEGPLSRPVHGDLAPAPVIGGGAIPSAGGTPTNEGLPGAAAEIAARKRRRRRRGGRGRRRHGTGDTAATRHENGVDGSSREEVGAEEPPAVPPTARVAETGAALESGTARGREPVAARTPAPPGASPDQAEEIPGGWWSRMRGPKKRGREE